MTGQIQAKLTARERLSPAEGLFLLSEAPLDLLAGFASAAKTERYGNRVSFVLDTNPNYTNLCNCHCRFCAFYRKPGDPGAFTLTAEQVVERVGEAVRAGATTVLMQGGCNPELPLEYYLGLVQALRGAFPDTHLHLFSPPEILAMARVGGITVRDILRRFHDLGLNSLPGGGAEILVERVRQAVSPGKCSAADWLRVMKEAHQLGFKTTATMVFGLGETVAEQLEHLLAIRDLQDATSGFTAFIPWSCKPPLAETPRLPGLHYLRMLATARLFLDNVPHIQASWFSEGKRTGQLGLLFGADDFGGTLFEEQVLKTAGHDVRSGIDEVKRLIRGAGMVPVQRDTLYRTFAPPSA